MYYNYDWLIGPSATTADDFLSVYQGQTFRDYTCVVNAFVRFLQESRTVQAQTEQEAIYKSVQAYMLTMKGKALSTRRRHLGTLTQLFKYAYQRGFVKFPVLLREVVRETATKEALRYHVEKETKRDHKVITKARFQRLRKYCAQHSPRDFVAYQLMWHYGFRCRELLELQRRDFMVRETDDGPVYTVLVYGKMEKRRLQMRQQPITQKAYQMVMSYMDRWGLTEPEDYFYTRQHGGNTTDFTVTKKPVKWVKSFNDNLEKLAVEALGFRPTSHDFRRGKVTQMMKEKCPYTEISARTGMSFVNIKRYDKSYGHGYIREEDDDILTEDNFA